MIVLEGSLQTSSWDDKETGKKKYKTEVIVERFHFTGKKASNEILEAPVEHYDEMAESYSNNHNQTGTQTSLPGNYEDEDDMPF